MWSIAGIRIYTQKYSSNTKNILPRLQPLNGGTVIQEFGYESPIINVECKVVGLANAEALEALATSGSSVTLETDLGSKTVYVSQIKTDRDPTLYQTIDPTQDCTAPVYSCSLELYE